MAFRRILVPLDFSNESLQALEQAADLGKKYGAELILLNVVDRIKYSGPGDAYTAAANIDIILKEFCRSSEEELKKLSAGLRRRGIKCRSFSQVGVPYDSIMHTAGKRGADLIVMATHGRTGLPHFLLGSVAEKVVRTATCPVLTVRPAAKRSKTRR